MTRFALFLFVTAALVPEGSAFFSVSVFKINARTYRSYSTQNTREALTTPGVEFYISPSDSFDFIPSAGYAAIEELEKDVAQAAEDHIEHVGFAEGSAEVADWGMTQLYTEKEQHESIPVPTKHEAPRPNQSLSGKVLKVESAKDLFPVEGICHLIEHETYMCHKPIYDVDIVEITVSPNGKSNKVWIACHANSMEDGVEDLCHVMNVGDVVFTATKLEKSKYVRKAEAFHAHN